MYHYVQAYDFYIHIIFCLRQSTTFPYAIKKNQINLKTAIFQYKKKPWIVRTNLELNEFDNILINLMLEPNDSIWYNILSCCSGPILTIFFFKKCKLFLRNTVCKWRNIRNDNIVKLRQRINLINSSSFDMHEPKNRKSNPNGFIIS